MYYSLNIPIIVFNMRIVLPRINKNLNQTLLSSDTSDRFWKAKCILGTNS